MLRSPTARRLTPARVLGALAAGFVLIQLVPYGRAHANPPVRTQPAWATPDTKALFDRACADCHSNQTVWPWYSNVAPVSWFVQRHVDEGREKFNVNEPGFGRSADEAAEEVRQGSMPLTSYLPMHPAAKLTNAERDRLIQGLAATFGQESGAERESGAEGGEGGESGEGHGDQH